MLNKDDCLYGFKRLSNNDVDKLIKLYKDKGVLRGISNREEAKRILWKTTYEGDRKDAYGGDLIKSGVLEVPGPLKGKSVKEIRERLQKHKRYSYSFKVSFESRYKNAIRILQQELRVPVDGKYTIETARALYERIRREVKKGQGYLASEDDPDRLFQSGFLEYIFCVDQVIWGLCELDEKWLRDDGDRVWEEDGPDTKSDSEGKCRKILEDMDTFGSSYGIVGELDGRVGEIFRDAIIKARDILDEIFYDPQRTISFVPNSSPYSYSYLKLYGILAKDKTWAYQVDKAAWEDLFMVIDIGMFAYEMSQSENAEYVGASIAAGLATLPSGAGWIPLGIGIAGLIGDAGLILTDPSPGLTDMLKQQGIGSVDSTEASDAQLKYYLVENSIWKCFRNGR